MITRIQDTLEVSPANIMEAAEWLPESEDKCHFISFDDESVLIPNSDGTYRTIVPLSN